MPLSSIDLSWARMSLVPDLRSGKKQFCKSFCFNVLEDGCCKHRAFIMGLVEAEFLCSLALLSLEHCRSGETFTSDR